MIHIYVNDNVVARAGATRHEAFGDTDNSERYRIAYHDDGSAIIMAQDFTGTSVEVMLPKRVLELLKNRATTG